MANVRIHPGPINNELLFLEVDHRAYNLFHTGENSERLLDRKRGDQKFWEILRHHPIPDTVMDYIRIAGFEGMIKCGMKFLDHALITALVERWRPETHTFHLPIGEVTVTLQDVQVLWGLRIDGEAVTGCDRKWEFDTKVDMCQRLLGITPTATDFKRAQLKIITVRDVLTTEFPDNASNEQCMRRARAYILVLLGGAVFADSNDNCVHMNLLALLEDFDRWNSPLSFANVPRYTISGYRSIVSAITDREIIFLLFVWTPYDDVFPEVSAEWLCNTYVIFWEIVEECLPSRVMRQFHLIQTIPRTPLSNQQEHERLHSLSRHGSSTTNWSSRLQPQINHWINRGDHVVTGDVFFHPTTVDGYMNWYLQRTVFHIVNSRPNVENFYRHQNLGGRLELAVCVCIYKYISVEGLSYVREGIGGVMESQPDYQQHLQGFYETAGNYLHFTQDGRTQNYGMHVVPADDFVPVNVNQVERLPRRQPQTQRRARHDDEAGPSNRGERAPSHHGEQTQFYQGEASGSHTQFTHGPPEPSGPYLYTTPPTPHMPFHASQDSTQYGNIYGNCYQPTFDDNNPLNRNNSPVSFDINLSWDLNETQEIDENETQEIDENERQEIEERPMRNRRAPDCGTGGRRGHLH
ncbi:hypothetical protein OSB04_017769 [Centaurea solstitialis]|uniref:Aminotransferase-like plant mobile domain-containing protein n=1 Tax=Centaurea solstitialis TaxID=347529 RepID=A0AA38T3I4_9ASTR|nr:hypothetical protein OSB04_017769 [Centaurea solstitialis]